MFWKRKGTHFFCKNQQDTSQKRLNQNLKAFYLSASAVTSALSTAQSYAEDPTRQTACSTPKSAKVYAKSWKDLLHILISVNNSSLEALWSEQRERSSEHRLLPCACGNCCVHNRDHCSREQILPNFYRVEVSITPNFQ